LKIVTIVGARPQFIKAAVVSCAFREHRSDVQEVIVHTGQHYDADMSDVFFEELDIPHPSYNLGIGGGTHGQNTGRMLEAIEAVLLKEKPDWVLVYGDTDSTLAGALAAAKLHIPVAHVEAGLRSFNRKMPEEINRVLTDHTSDILFSPTETAVKNLFHEGIAKNKIYLVGDAMYDAAKYYAAIADAHSNILSQLRLSSKNYILATVHRAENTDDPVRLQAIFQGFVQVAKEIPVIIPLHPRTRMALIKEDLLSEILKKLYIIDPTGYIDMIMLEKNACLIATDSGGLQKEAFFHHVPCVTLRNETEWIELVECGWNRLITTWNSSEIKNSIKDFLSRDFTRQVIPVLYGNGMSAIKMVNLIIKKRNFT